ncbi:MAG: heat-inducible transcriptional repressor HrcA [Chloroflexota bacterium]
MFKPLSERQEQILGLLVQTYVETGLPVGSKTLVERFVLDISPATVRHELAALDEAGYVTQIHTSGGRIPTEFGYRYFVQRLLRDFELPVTEQQMIRHQFHQARTEMEQWMRLAAAILARTSQGASLVTAPRPRQNRFKHLELISTQGRLVLLILVLFGGEVKQQMLTLAEPASQARLSQAAERLNALLEGLSLGDLQARLGQLSGLEEDIARLVLDVIQRADERGLNSFYHDGLLNLLNDESTRQAVRVLEERTLLSMVLAEMLETAGAGVQVVIGGEGRWAALKDCALILSRYGVNGELSGEVAVLGPTRMPYGRNISAVRYVADLMSGFVHEYYVNEPLLSLEDPRHSQAEL